MVPGDLIVVRLEKPVAGGAMLGHHEGRVILVDGAIPGELLRVRIGRVARGYARGSAVEVIEADPDRRQPTGDPACGGTVYAHIAYPRQLRLKREVLADAFTRIARCQLPGTPTVAPSPERGYRMRARLQVRDGRLGFVRTGTHRICDPATTGQLLQDTERALAALERWLVVARWPDLQAVALAENLGAAERVLHLDARVVPRRIGDAAPLHDAGFTGLTVRQAKVSTLFGSPTVSDPVAALVRSVRVDGAIRLRRQAGTFFQANRYLVGDLVEAVLREAHGEPILDLYAGVGLHAIAQAAAGRRRITAVEGNARTIRDLRANAAPLAGAVRVRHAPVEDFVAGSTGEPVSSAIVNPPRTGLSRQVLDGLSRLAPERIVYVSCDVATLARDVRRLVDSHYALTHLEAFDLFPNTAHLESMAVLVRA